jgi:hypothetical protein
LKSGNVGKMEKKERHRGIAASAVLRRPRSVVRGKLPLHRGLTGDCRVWQLVVCIIPSFLRWSFPRRFVRCLVARQERSSRIPSTLLPVQPKPTSTSTCPMHHAELPPPALRCAASLPPVLQVGRCFSDTSRAASETNLKWVAFSLKMDAIDNTEPRFLIPPPNPPNPLPLPLPLHDSQSDHPVATAAAHQSKPQCIKLEQP